MRPERLAALLREEMREQQVNERVQVVELVLGELIAELDGDHARLGLLDMAAFRDRSRLRAVRQALVAALVAAQHPEPSAVEPNTWSHWP